MTDHIMSRERTDNHRHALDTAARLLAATTETEETS